MSTVLDYRRKQVGAAATAQTPPSPIPDAPPVRPMLCSAGVSPVVGVRELRKELQAHVNAEVRRPAEAQAVHKKATEFQSHRITMRGEEMDEFSAALQEVLKRKDLPQDTWQSVYYLEFILRRVRPNGSRYEKQGK